MNCGGFWCEKKVKKELPRAPQARMLGKREETPQSSPGTLSTRTVSV